jgi:hypothetical protein
MYLSLKSARNPCNVWCNGSKCDMNFVGKNFIYLQRRFSNNDAAKIVANEKHTIQVQRLYQCYTASCKKILHLETESVLKWLINLYNEGK